jgi:hypothetical protein
MYRWCPPLEVPRYLLVCASKDVFHAPTAPDRGTHSICCKAAAQAHCPARLHLLAAAAHVRVCPLRCPFPATKLGPAEALCAVHVLPLAARPVRAQKHFCVSDAWKAGSTNEV